MRSRLYQRPRTELLEQLAEIVGARNRPAEIGRVLDHAGSRISGDASRLELRDRLVLGLARGLRRSGANFRSIQVAARPGTALVTHLIQQARTKALDSQIARTGDVRKRSAH